MSTVTVIGAGPLGRWLALEATRAGYDVTLEDVMPANLHHAREFIRRQLGPEGAPNVRFASSIDEAVREADLVIDCVPDELESKLEILWLLDRMAPPRTVLATPTTHLSIADLAACTYRADKCVAIVAAPADLTGDSPRTVRVRLTSQTSSETRTLVEDFWRRLGLEPAFECEG